MWFQKSQRRRQFDRRWSTTWPARTASQAGNGSAAAWPVLPARWPPRHRFSGSSDQIARKRSGPAASVCRPLMAAGQLKTGRQSLNLFSKKWTLTRKNTLGLVTVIHTRMTMFTCGCAVSEVTECYGIRSTQQNGRSRRAANWRPNLI